MQLTKTLLAQTGLFIAICGVTASSFLFGAQSFGYYFFILTGVALSAPLILNGILLSSRSLWTALVTSAFPLALYLVHSAFIPQYGLAENGPFVYFGISITLVLAISAGVMTPSALRTLMYWVALSHILLAVYAVWNGEALVLEAQQSRFGALGVREAIWSELVLGAFVAALLTAQTWLMAAAAAVAGIVLVGTQMRGSGIALVAALAVYVYLVADLNKRYKALFVMVLAGIVGALLFSKDIMNLVGTILLLDDPHRGLDSGFSGRFDNWSAGFGRFMESPLIGVGMFDPVAAYTHNGYLKLLAQFGLLFGAWVFMILAIALKRLVAIQRPELAAATACYCVFIISAPRYINFQIMPFVGLVAIAHICLEGVPRLALRRTGVNRRSGLAA